MKISDKLLYLHCNTSELPISNVCLTGILKSNLFIITVLSEINPFFYKLTIKA